MNDQHKQENPTAPTILPAKRRRGRPRKDEGPAKRIILQTPIAPVPEMSQKDSTDGNMLGQIVSGVIDGSFDAGYFLSVKLGNNATMLRGLVFEPGRFSPITAANDIAPQVKMHHRSRVITLQDQENSTKKQLDMPPGQILPDNRHADRDEMLKIQSQFTPLLENLRMVEQDEVMEVFEVMNQSERPELNAEPSKFVDFSESMLGSKASEGTSASTSKGENQYNNNVVDKSQEMELDRKQVNFEVVENKSNLETLLQPRELVQCEQQKLEIHQARRIDTQELPTINPEIQLKELSQSGQGNQDFQPHQTPPFLELNFVAQESVAAESKLQPSDPILSELKNSSFEVHFIDMPQAVESVQENPRQVLPQESVSGSMDVMMEKQSSTNIKEQQSSDVGTQVKVLGKEETSHEREQASDLN
ncbi:uncharacterized protein LOC132617471 [Lycium barbarum]|uniref:uncharacterized protein LOC132617471 n=1 Tax=Lycium barbarum TaxID=112863 RepID=UPI00293E21F9|nr:uncharacterized protein LOC132617471 [Lycium barbarum]